MDLAELRRRALAEAPELHELEQLGDLPPTPLNSQPVLPTAAGKLLDLLGVAADARAFAHVGAAHRLTVGATLPAPAPIFPRYVEAEEGASTPAKP